MKDQGFSSPLFRIIHAARQVQQHSRELEASRVSKERDLPTELIIEQQREGAIAALLVLLLGERSAPARCWECSGSGQIEDDRGCYLSACPKCKGSGKQ